MSDSEEHSDTEVQDEEMEETVDAEKEKSGAVSWKAFSDGEKLVETEEEPVDKVPNFVKCRVCSGVYKRAVKLPCCGYRACRACAVKHATKLKKCWNKKCGKPLATSDLENDEEQREKVTKWMERKAKWEEGLKGGDLLKCSVCEEICKRAVSMSCCGKAACRACAVKKLTAKRECWIESCSAIGKSSDELENDDLVREAIEHFKKHGEMDMTHAKKIFALRQKLNPDKKKIKKKTTKKARRQPPKNKKDIKLAAKKYAKKEGAKKPAEKKENKADKDTKTTKAKPAQKKKVVAKKQDTKPAQKRTGGFNPRQGRPNMYMQRGWGNNMMAQQPWRQPPMAMGGSPFMRNNPAEMRLREENMMMKRMLMKMNSMREMGPSRGFAGNAWGDNSMMRRF